MMPLPNGCRSQAHRSGLSGFPTIRTAPSRRVSRTRFCPKTGLRPQRLCAPPALTSVWPGTATSTAASSSTTPAPLLTANMWSGSWLRPFWPKTLAQRSSTTPGLSGTRRISSQRRAAAPCKPAPGTPSSSRRCVTKTPSTAAKCPPTTISEISFSATAA